MMNYTFRRQYTDLEVIDELSHLVREENLRNLILHLTDEKLSKAINGFDEAFGQIIFYIGDSYIPIAVKPNEIIYNGY